jgi:hypothetical protein
VAKFFMNARPQISPYHARRNANNSSITVTIKIPTACQLCSRW